MPYSILIIDDDEMALLVRRLVLEDAGYVVVTAANTGDALHIFATRHLDLVIADHMLLPNSETSLATEFRRLSPELPLLTLSGNASLPTVDSIPPDYFLHKLEGPGEMIAKVRFAINTAHAQLRGGKSASELGLGEQAC